MQQNIATTKRPTAVALAYPSGRSPPSPVLTMHQHQAVSSSASPVFIDTPTGHSSTMFATSNTSNIGVGEKVVDASSPAPYICRNSATSLSTSTPRRVGGIQRGRGCSPRLPGGIVGIRRSHDYGSPSSEKVFEPVDRESQRRVPMPMPAPSSSSPGSSVLDGHDDDIEQGGRGQFPLQDCAQPEQKRHRVTDLSQNSGAGDKSNDNRSFAYKGFQGLLPYWRCDKCQNFGSNSFDDVLSHETICNAQPEYATNAESDNDESMTNDEPRIIQYYHEDKNESNIDENAVKVSLEPAGTLDLGKGGKGFVKTSWGNMAKRTQFRRDKFKLLTREGQIGDMDKKLAEEVIGNCLVWLLFVNPVFGTVTYCAWYIAGMMMHMISSMAVFVIYFARGAAASGFDWKRLYATLMKYPFFRTIIRKIEENYVLARLGMIWNESGDHRWHSDSFQERTDFRGILSLLSSVKIMWFRDTRTGAQFGITVPHSAFIVLTRYGSGAEGSLEHKVTGAGNSAIFTFDFRPKK
eukprot:scaffold37567_cov272-Skeletonema_dohrnii-CCMP3373.AAC.2